MRVSIESMEQDFRALQRGKASNHTIASRTRPSRWQYDYLALGSLSTSISQLIQQLPGGGANQLALDLGSGRSPYRSEVEDRGYTLRTLDLSPASGADYVGCAEQTGLPDNSFDLVLCTQVLEHTDDPWQAAREIRRILKPGGYAILSAPHVWFYHPHPRDHWRFTQQGLVRLVEEAGLTPIELLSQGGTVLTFGQVTNFLIYGVTGRWGAPIFAIVNAISGALDRHVRNQLFCHNFAILSSRR
jgi:SAM-dependent methyltransferase